MAAADLFFRLWANLDLARVDEGSGFRVSRVSGRCLITFPRYQCKGISSMGRVDEFKWNQIMYLITIHMYLYSEFTGLIIDT